MFISEVSRPTVTIFGIADDCYADASLGAHVSLAYAMCPSHHFRG